MIKINYKRNKEKINKIMDIINSIKDKEINKVVKEIEFTNDQIKRIKDMVYAMKIVISKYTIIIKEIIFQNLKKKGLKIKSITWNN